MNHSAADVTYEEIIDKMVGLLADAGLLRSSPATTPWDAFLRLSDRVHGNFEIPTTTFTPIMRRLVFALGMMARPRNIVGVGTYVGYTFSWLIGDRADEAARPCFETAIGIDIDSRANELARRNCAVLGHGDRLKFLDSDGFAALRSCTDPIDLLYLDVDDKVTGKAAYRDLLQAAVPRLRPKAIVLAHDPCVASFRRDFDAYHEFINTSESFAEALVLAVDECGLSVTARTM
jgi:predicted O-methyltransferase YrrM